MLSRWILKSVLISSMGLALVACDNKINERVEATKAAAVSLGQGPQQFQLQYNASLEVIVPVVLKQTNGVIDQSLINMYQIYQMTHMQGKEQGLIEADVGPLRTHLIGKVNDKGELMSVGANLRDNSANAKQDFLIVMTTIGYVVSGAQPQQMADTLQRLMSTALSNPSEVVAASINDIVFTVSISNVGITIQAAHVQ